MNTVVNFKQIALSDPQAEPISITQTIAYLDTRFAQDDADLERALDELAGAQDDDAAPVAAPGEPPMSPAERRLVARITHRPDSKPLELDQLTSQLDCVLDRRGKATSAS